MASEVSSRRSDRASHHLEDAEKDAQSEYIAVDDKRGDSDPQGSYESEEASASLEEEDVTTTLCRADRACQEPEESETDAQNEHIAVDKRRRDTGDSGHFSYRASCASYAEDSSRLAEMASEVMTRLCMASLACQELELDYAENDDQDEYIAVDASRCDTGVPVEVDQGVEFDDQGAIDATGRAAQSRRKSCDLGSRRSSYDLGVPADSRQTARRGSKTPTEVEPIYDSALYPPTPPTPDVSAVARIIALTVIAESRASGKIDHRARLRFGDRDSGDDGDCLAYEAIVCEAPHAPRVSLPVDEDAIYGLLGQREQPYENPRATKKPYEPPRAAKQPYENPRAADHLYSPFTDEGGYVRLGNGGIGGTDRRSRADADCYNYENAYDCLGHNKAESLYSSLQSESVRSSVYEDSIVDAAMLY